MKTDNGKAHYFHEGHYQSLGEDALVFSLCGLREPQVITSNVGDVTCKSCLRDNLAAYKAGLDAAYPDTPCTSKKL